MSHDNGYISTLNLSNKKPAGTLFGCSIAHQIIK